MFESESAAEAKEKIRRDITTVDMERRKSAPTCKRAVNIFTAWPSFPWMDGLAPFGHVRLWLSETDTGRAQSLRLLVLMSHSHPIIATV